MGHDRMRQAQSGIIDPVRRDGGADARPGFVQGPFQHFHSLRAEGRDLQQPLRFHWLPLPGAAPQRPSWAAVGVRTIHPSVSPRTRAELSGAALVFGWCCWPQSIHAAAFMLLKAAAYGVRRDFTSM